MTQERPTEAIERLRITVENERRYWESGAERTPIHSLAHDGALDLAANLDYIAALEAERDRLREAGLYAVAQWHSWVEDELSGTVVYQEAHDAVERVRAALEAGREIGL